MGSKGLFSANGLDLPSISKLTRIDGLAKSLFFWRLALIISGDLRGATAFDLHN